MVDKPNAHEDAKPKSDKPVGDGEGGADSSGSGNILAGVQPDAEPVDDKDERRDG